MLITCQYGHALDIAPFGLHLEWLQCPTCEDESVVMLTPEGAEIDMQWVEKARQILNRGSVFTLPPTMLFESVGAD